MRWASSGARRAGLEPGRRGPYRGRGSVHASDVDAPGRAEALMAATICRLFSHPVWFIQGGRESSSSLGCHPPHCLREQQHNAVLRVDRHSAWTGSRKYTINRKTYHVGSRLAMVSLLELAILSAAGLEVGGQSALDRGGRHLGVCLDEAVMELCWVVSRRQDQAVVSRRFVCIARGEAQRLWSRGGL